MEDPNFIRKTKIAAVLLALLALAILFSYYATPRKESPEIERIKASIKESELKSIQIRKENEAIERERSKKIADEYMANKARTERADAAIERARIQFGNALADAEGR